MFDDLGELDDIFYQLDESAQLPDSERLEWICGLNSEFIKQINFLGDAVTKLEQATIDKGVNDGLKIGFSHESEILAELYFLLTMDCETPARLLVSLPSLKVLLSKAMAIDMEIKAGTLKLLAGKGEKYSDLQKKFREDQQRADDAKHDQWRKWQADEKNSNAQFAKQSKQEQAKRLRLKHSINDKFSTIAKRLEPLPSIKRTK